MEAVKFQFAVNLLHLVAGDGLHLGLLQLLAAVNLSDFCLFDVKGHLE